MRGRRRDSPTVESERMWRQIGGCGAYQGWGFNGREQAEWLRVAVHFRGGTVCQHGWDSPGVRRPAGGWPGRVAYSTTGSVAAGPISGALYGAHSQSDTPPLASSRYPPISRGIARSGKRRRNRQVQRALRMMPMGRGTVLWGCWYWLFAGVASRQGDSSSLSPIFARHPGRVTIRGASSADTLGCRPHVPRETPQGQSDGITLGDPGTRRYTAAGTDFQYHLCPDKEVSCRTKPKSVRPASAAGFPASSPALSMCIHPPPNHLGQRTLRITGKCKNPGLP